MRSVLALTATLLLVEHSWGKVTFEYLKAHVKHPGHCYIERTKEKHAEDEEWYKKGECQMYSCKRSAAGYKLGTHRCGFFHLPTDTESCTFVEEKNLQFPACCPKLLCPKD